MFTVVGISGSLRRGSLNSMLLRAAAELMPPDSRLQILSIAEIPLYDGDVEVAGVPAEVNEAKSAVMAAGALLIVAPEYNGGMPGVAKNALDWMSRPPADKAKVYGGLPVAVTGATPGLLGTATAQAAWLPVLRNLGTEVWPERLLVPYADKAFDASGRIVDEALRTNLGRYMAGFVEWAKKRRALG